MRCEDGRERLSRLVDGELAETDQAGLFGHLEACDDCRAFLETLIRVRGAVQRDREALWREADETLPPWPPRPAVITPPVGRERRTPSWRGLPTPAVLALAAVLLVVGVGIGAGLGGRDGAERTRVVYVCAMPEYEVVGQPEPGTGQ